MRQFGCPISILANAVNERVVLGMRFAIFLLVDCRIIGRPPSACATWDKADTRIKLSNSFFSIVRSSLAIAQRLSHSARDLGIIVSSDGPSDANLLNG